MSCKNKDVKTLFSLFTTFFKIGAFTFGGGYAMIPVIQKEIVEKHKWLTDDDILEIIAVSESTPGPIAINSATFVGYKIAGFWGAFFSTTAVVLPSFFIIGIISSVLRALFLMYKKCPKGVFSYVIMALSFILSAFLNINLIFIIIFCGVLGLTYSLLITRRDKK